MTRYIWLYTLSPAAREKSPARLQAKPNGDDVTEKSRKGMLPKNKLRKIAGQYVCICRQRAQTRCSEPEND